MSFRNRRLLDQLVRNRFRKKKDVEEIVRELEKETLEAKRLSWRNRGASGRKPYISGVHNGVYYRIKVPSKRKKLPEMPILRTPQMAPKGFRPVETPPSVQMTDSKSAKEAARVVSAHGGRGKNFRRQTREWWDENWPIVVLNFGSICTLTGFTRADVLELRCLAVTGSVCSAIFQSTLRPFKIVPILWTATFAGVNSWNIYKILQERKSTVRLTRDQEEIYIKHFMPHGITPKQFEMMYAKASIVEYEKGSIIIKQGEEQNAVLLIVKGQTRASVLGRRLSAASVTETKEDDEDSNKDYTNEAGAWVGEMAFLEQYWLKEQEKLMPVTVRDAGNESNSDTKGDEKPKKRTTKERSSTGARRGSGKNDDDRQNGEVDVRLTSKRTFKVSDAEMPLRETKTKNSLYTIMVTDDCTALRWTHGDMEKLMRQSTDMRAALTRAMTAAIVGKVIHFTVSRSQSRRTWSAWLNDWQHSAGARIEVDDEDNETQKLPTYPLKKFA